MLYTREISVILSNPTLTGNKCDRVSNREVPERIGQDFADRHDMRFLETSAKDSENVETLFLEIAQDLTREARENDLWYGGGGGGMIGEGRGTAGASVLEGIRGGTSTIVTSCCKS